MSREFLNRRRTLYADVDPELVHDLNGLGSDVRGDGSRAGDLESIIRIVTQELFSHLTPRGIGCAPYEDTRLVHKITAVGESNSLEREWCAVPCG